MDHSLDYPVEPGNDRGRCVIPYPLITTAKQPRDPGSLEFLARDRNTSFANDVACHYSV